MVKRAKLIGFWLLAFLLVQESGKRQADLVAGLPFQEALITPHTVQRLEDGHTLIADGGIAHRDPARRGTRSRVIEVDEAGNTVWTFETDINWIHSAQRLPNGNTLIADTGNDRVIEIDPSGNIVWNSDEVPLSDGSHLNYPNDADWLENDHLLITDANNHRIIEIERDGTIVWQFGETGVSGSDSTHLNGPHNADRLPNGNTLVADSNNLRILEIAPDGSIVWSFRPSWPQTLRWPRDADRLENGNTLITDSRNDRVIEVTPEGQIVWEYTGLNVPYDADRLPNGHTLISSAPGNRIIEVDPTGNIVWEYPPSQTPAAGEPPIYIMFNVHFDPILDDYQRWKGRKDNLLWLKSFVESYSGVYQPRLNLQVQGDHAEFYLDPNDPEAAEGRAALKALYEAGHSFGTHMHNTVRGEEPHSWSRVVGTPTAAQSVESWQDHITWVEQLYAELTGNADPAFLQQMNASAATIFPPGVEAQIQAFSGTFSDPVSGATVPHGFSIQTGGPNEAFYCFFDHDVQNPWRPGIRGPLDEDLSTPFVRIPQMPPLGDLGYHGPSNCYEDNTLPARQRMFIQVLLERLYREYTGAEDKIWTFGWHEHLFDIYPEGSQSTSAEPQHTWNAFRDEVQQMVEWLNERFIGRTTANGHLIAKYATVTEVRDAFLAWEAQHPGTSSFEFIQYTSNWEDYPYLLKGLARELANAHYEAALLPPESNLQVYRFVRGPSSLRGETQGYWAWAEDGTLGCYDAASRDGKAEGNPLPTTPVYVAWRDAPTPEPIDLTIYVGDQAVAIDGVTGDTVASALELKSYALDYRPVVLLPGEATPPTEEIPPLYFFYAIHTHLEGDWLPYTNPAMLELDTTVARNLVASIEGIAGILDQHGAKGTWEVVFGVSKGLAAYQGQNHILGQLLQNGHEIAIHAHRNEHIRPAFENLRDYCGITARTTSGFMGEVFLVGAEQAQEVLSQAIEIALSLGMTIGTENLAPLDPRNPFATLCNQQFGEGNDMWQNTGNLMFPWKPDYRNRNICAHDPEAEMVFVDHVGPWWMKLPGQGIPDVLTDAHFAQLREMFDAALAYMEEHRPNRVAAWGFVTHLHEYAVGKKGENPPEEESLAALDRFLDYVDTKVAEGRVIYATVSQIAELAFPEATAVEESPSGTESGPRSFVLEQNYPNPFNPTTTIRFTLPKRARVQLTVFNVAGQAVATLVDDVLEAGEHAVVWEASVLPAGVYFYRLKAGSQVKVRKAVLMK